MNSIGISLSGLHAASLRLSNSAHNVANIHSTSKNVNGRLVRETPEATEVVQSSLEPTGGVQAEVRVREPGTVKVYNPDHSDANAEGIVEYPNVNLEEEIVQQQFATYDFKANLRAIKVADENLQALLDIQS